MKVTKLTSKSIKLKHNHFYVLILDIGDFCVYYVASDKVILISKDRDIQRGIQAKIPLSNIRFKTTGWDKEELEEWISEFNTFTGEPKTSIYEFHFTHELETILKKHKMMQELIK